MVQLQNDKEKFQKANIQIVGVSYDNLGVIKKFAESKSIDFPLLSDEGSKVIKSLDLEYKGGLPHPGTIIVDQKGVVRAKIFKEGYRLRHNSDELLKALGQINASADPSEKEPAKQGSGSQ